jgi:hypothetical protein
LVLAAFVPGSTALVWVAMTSLVLAPVLLLRIRHLLGPLLRDGLRTFSDQLTDQSRGSATCGWAPLRRGGRERPKAPS